MFLLITASNLSKEREGGGGLQREVGGGLKREEGLKAPPVFLISVQCHFSVAASCKLGVKDTT